MPSSFQIDSFSSSIEAFITPAFFMSFHYAFADYFEIFLFRLHYFSSLHISLRRRRLSFESSFLHTFSAIFIFIPPPAQMPGFVSLFSGRLSDADAVAELSRCFTAITVSDASSRFSPEAAKLKVFSAATA